MKANYTCYLSTEVKTRVQWTTDWLHLRQCIVLYTHNLFCVALSPIIFRGHMIPPKGLSQSFQPQFQNRWREVNCFSQVERWIQSDSWSQPQFLQQGRELNSTYVWCTCVVIFNQYNDMSFKDHQRELFVYFAGKSLFEAILPPLSALGKVPSEHLTSQKRLRRHLNSLGLPQSKLAAVEQDRGCWSAKRVAKDLSFRFEQNLVHMAALLQIKFRVLAESDLHYLILLPEYGKLLADLIALVAKPCTLAALLQIKI